MAGVPVRFRHLQTFLEVARQRSVGRAAELLHVSQPAVTRTIRELETALGGVALFERDGRGIRITRYGEVFLRHAGASVAAVQQGIDSVARAQLNSGPPLRVGALPTVAARIMPRAVQLFLAEETGSPIKIVTGENRVLFEQLRLGQLDLVVGRLAAPEQMNGLSFEHLYSEHVVFVVHRGHPLLRPRRFDFARLRDFIVLMPTRGSIIRPFVERFLLSHGIADLPREVETVSDAFARALLRSSEAVWIISEGVVALDLEDERLATLPIDTSETRGSVGLTSRAGESGTGAIEILARTIRETVAEQRLR